MKRSSLSRAPGLVLRRIALRPVAFSLALILSTGLPEHVGAQPRSALTATQIDTWKRALKDPRFRQLRTLDAELRRAPAHDYGLQYRLHGFPYGGTTLAVTNCSGIGPGSLRDTIAGAASGDTVDASALTCSGISIGNGAIAIPQDDLTIVGPGMDAFTVTTTYVNRIFDHTGAGTLNLRGMTVAGGQDVSSTDDTKGGCVHSSGSVALGNSLDPRPTTGVAVINCTASSTASGGSSSGGGIYTIGSLQMTNSIVSGCAATTDNGNATGGGVYAYAGLSMRYSEISHNQSTGNVGGVFSYGTTSIESSTLADNTAAGIAGAAGISGLGDILLVNATISGNHASIAAGLDVYQSGGNATTAIYNSTIAANVSAPSHAGAGLRLIGANLDLESTIIAGNVAGTTTPADLDTTMATSVSGSNNLVGSAAGSTPPDTLIGVDPRLGPLANHGGVTPTYLLLAGSPAINAGNNVFGAPFDQRGPGFVRVSGGAPDIGATEYDGIFSNGFD